MVKTIKLVFFLTVTILIFYLIFQKIDYGSLKRIFLNANLSYLALSPLMFLLSLIISTKKWQAMVRAMNYSLSFRQSLNIVMAALPISTITPSRSGDLIRAYYLKDSIPPEKTAGAVLTERLIDISILALYSFIGALLFKNWLILKISLSIIFLIPLLLFFASKIRLPFPKWQQRIKNFLIISRIFIRYPKKILPVLFFALMHWLVAIFEAKILFLILGANISLFYIAAAFPIAIFIGLIPITIAGMGTRDSAIIYFFSSLAEPSICLGVGFLYTLFGYWFLALLGLPAMKKLLMKRAS